MNDSLQSYAPDDPAPWVQWRELCALGRCDSAARAALTIWARNTARKWKGTLDPDILDNAFQELDSWLYMQPPNRTLRNAAGPATTDDKTPQMQMVVKKKAQIFAAGAAETEDILRLRMVKSYARAVLDTQLRKRATDETWGRRNPTKGFQKTTIARPDDLESASWDACLVDAYLPSDDFLGPADQAEIAEITALAPAQAENLLKKLDQRQRLVLAARSSTVPLTAPAVLKAAGCTKSQLYETEKSAITALQKCLIKEYEGSADASLTCLAREVLRLLGKKCRSEFPELFSGNAAAE